MAPLRPSWFYFDVTLVVWNWEFNFNFDVWNKWFGFINQDYVTSLEFFKMQFTLDRDVNRKPLLP